MRATLLRSLQALHLNQRAATRAYSRGPTWRNRGGSNAAISSSSGGSGVIREPTVTFDKTGKATASCGCGDRHPHKHTHEHLKKPGTAVRSGTRRASVHSSARNERDSVLKPQDYATAKQFLQAPPLQQIYDANMAWVEDTTKDDPTFFQRQEYLHKPDYFFIGCSDARVSVQEMTGLKGGEVFVHRNIANTVVNTDLNFISVLTYAVDFLKVKDVIVCGHYNCGGVIASLADPFDDPAYGALDCWLMNLRDIQRMHSKELAEIKEERPKQQRLVELNVMEQCLRLFYNPIIQRAHRRHKMPKIHGMVYDVGNGLLKPIDIPVGDIFQVQ